MILFLFNRKKKSNVQKTNEPTNKLPYEISKEEYGRKCLSRLMLISGERYFQLFENSKKEMSFSHYLYYVQSLLFITQMILQGKYSYDDVNIIIDSTIIGFCELNTKIKPEGRQMLKQVFASQYYQLVDTMGNNCSISNVESINKLANVFLENCLGEDKRSIMLVHIEFMAFIKFHISDILNKNFILI